MDVVRHRDPILFRTAVEEHLRRDEPRHNLFMGLVTTLVDQPDVYPRFHLWTVDEGGRIVCAALRTEPHNVILSEPELDGAVEVLVDALLEERAEVPGVIGALPEADLFATRFLAATGASVSSRTDQAIHVLHRPADVPVPSGSARPATPDDLELICAWSHAFWKEAVPHDHYDPEQARRRTAHRLAETDGGGYRVWVDGEPVCLVGSGGALADTPRVGPVYTPPEHRRKGYGTALTAYVSRELLADGVRYCLLYTDLANPTSNAIYAKIGYRRVCDSAMILFGRSG